MNRRRVKMMNKGDGKSIVVEGGNGKEQGGNKHKNRDGSNGRNKNKSFGGRGEKFANQGKSQKRFKKGNRD